MKRIAVEKIIEAEKNGLEYILIKISVNQKESFCACIDGEELAVEGLGGDCCEARELFERLLSNNVSALHLAEIIRDERIKNYF